VKELIDLVRSFEGARVAVMGDPIVDVYHFGHVHRLSPEAPLPVFVEDRCETRPGGAANVAANLVALGCTPITLFPPQPHSVKHRYFVGHLQVGMRIDHDEDHSKREVLPQMIALPHALIISDYGKGFCTRDRCQRNIGMARRDHVPVVVDPKGPDWQKYAGATIVCPSEFELIQGYDEHDGHILHKQGAKGMTLIFRDRTEHKFEARARQVFDVTGAGDTVVAVMGAALARTKNMVEAAMLANMAAGVVVGKVGTATCSRDELLQEIERG
jgi:D-beta-D-heptose 7-phosphate kinase / D-beta-D-heptose 1-phosphate adenosyltransferase